MVFGDPSETACSGTRHAPTQIPGCVLGPWYVPPALGERPTSARQRWHAFFAAAVLLPSIALGLSACGDDAQSQDANEPEGNFPVEVTMAKFPTEQRLAQTSDLILSVKNTGDQALPELVFTIETDDLDARENIPADGSFNIRLDDD